MEEDDIFGVYWRHFDIAKTDKLYWILGSFHVSHFGKKITRIIDFKLM